MKNYYELLSWGKDVLEQAEKEEVDARYLLFFLKKWTLTDYLQNRGEQVPDQIEQDYVELINKRLSGIPVQELTGSQNFYGYEIQVNSEVLTPRPETEYLVELALKKINSIKAPKILDLCTGSGCIAIAIAGENSQAEITAVDISDKALALAKINAENNHVSRQIKWVESDLFNSLSHEKFDVIISNPPYIPSSDIENLDIEVKEYDPILALDGGSDGLYFYQKIADLAKDYLNPHGKLFLEIGNGQGKAVVQLLKSQGWQNPRLIFDYSERERMVIAEL